MNMNEDDEEMDDKIPNLYAIIQYADQWQENWQVHVQMDTEVTYS